MGELEQLRGRIDELDRELLKLFTERMEICTKVGEYKLRIGAKVLDPEREKQVLDSKLKMLDKPELKSEVYDFFSNIMTISRTIQGRLMSEAEGGDACDKVIECAKPSVKNPKVAYFGDEGSYTEEAAIKYFGEEVSRSCKSDFMAVLKLAAEGETDYAVVPIENSSTGTVADVSELIADMGLYIVGEVYVPVRHCLVGLEGAETDKIKKIYSHNQAIMQCSDFLGKLSGAEAEDYLSTARSAKKVAELNDKTCAAIASERTAKLYNLAILEKNIANNSCNTTRFAVTARRPEMDDKSNKISVVFTLKHESGQLYRILGAFARCGLNLLKLESRPIADRPFEYRFYADYTGNLMDEKVKAVTDEVIRETQSFDILGCYDEWNGSTRRII